MNETVVSKRYSKAIYELAKEQNILSEVQNELSTISQTIIENEELSNFLLHPNVDSNHKIAFFQNTFQHKISELTMSTVGILIKNRRMSALPQIIEELSKLTDDGLGQAKALVYSAHSLHQQELNKIKNHFSKLLNKKIKIENIIDQSMIGGIRVKIGDQLYDGSIASQLKVMAKSIAY